MAQIIDGKLIAESIRQQVAVEVAALKKSKNITPGLCVVLVGEDPASQVYVKSKIATTEAIGMKSFQHFLSADTKQEVLLDLIKKLNADPAVHGILVQLPLPKHLDSEFILDQIDPKKDVDGLHPVNLGLLLAGKKGFIPCTPHGVMKMLEFIKYDLSGKHAVVIGRSNIVGKPMGLLLLQQNATVTFVHSKTKDMVAMIKSADVVVAAVGKPKMVKGDWLKPGAVVIDVGINRDANGKLCGDVDFEDCKNIASAITPVPGGVGPMTIAMLMYNTLHAAQG